MMIPDQRRWLRRAKELAADVQRGFEAQNVDSSLVGALMEHIKALMGTPEWQDVGTLDAFLRDMLPLADCCASLEARLPGDNQGNAELAWQRILLAGEVSRLSWQLLSALHLRFKLSASAPPSDLVNRLALSATVPIRWLPKALRAAADRELGQATQPATRHGWPGLLDLAMMATAATLVVLGLMSYAGRHVDMLRPTLYAPAALASLLGNLAAVHAHFARSPATFKDQAKEWGSLAVLAASLLETLGTVAVVAAVEENEDVRQQLSAALLPYAAHLLKVADITNASWLGRWGKLVRALASPGVWPDLEAGLGGATQCSRAVAEGLLRLLRVLPPLDKPPGFYRHDWGWMPLLLNTARAAAVAATKALKLAGPVPSRQDQVAALREVQQQGFHMLVVLLPITVDLLAAAAGQLAVMDANAGASGAAVKMAWAQSTYSGTLTQLVLLMGATGPYVAGTVQGVREQPGELAAAGEVALRLATQAAALAQPPNQSLGALEEVLYRGGMLIGQYVFVCLTAAAQQEVSAAPEPGGVRPSLQVQLHLVHTACKFARAALAPGAAASASGSSAGGKMEDLHLFVRHIFVHCTFLLVDHVHAEDIPDTRATLTPAERRALIGAALAMSAASSAVVHLLPEGLARNIQSIQMCFDLCRLLSEPDLVGTLLAQNAELPEQLVTGLAAVMNFRYSGKEREGWSSYDCYAAVEKAVQASRRLGPMMLGGAAGEALEAGLRCSLQGSAHQGPPKLWITLIAVLAAAAEGCFNGSRQAAAVGLQRLLEGPAGEEELAQEGWEMLHVVRAAADEWLAQEAQQQWRQEQLLLCAEAVATRACSNLACVNLSGASEAGLKARLCSGCRCVRYCSTACQRADWAAGLKAVCKRL